MAINTDDDRVLLVQVTGLRWQNNLPTSEYTFKVPYRSLSRTLQFIKRSGGKIVRIEAMILPLPEQDLYQPSTSSEVIETAAIAAPLSPSQENLEETASTADDVKVSEPMPPSPAATDGVSEVSPKPGLLTLLIEKLRLLLAGNPSG